MRRLQRRVVAAVGLFVFVLSIFVSGAWAAQGNTAYGVYVQDDAAVISVQTKNELYNRAIWLHEQTQTAQVGIVTVESLENQSLEDFAVSKFRELGLGSKERNDGVLLLYVASDRHVRIEVGYGLEGRIPDGKAGTILDTYFVPNRDIGQLDEAFSQTQSALIEEVSAEYGIDPSGITQDRSPMPVQEGNGFLTNVPGYVKLLLGIGAVFLIFLDFKFTGGMITFSILNLIGRRGSGGRGGGGGGRGGGGSSGGGGASR